jgi:iron complex outermembrane recepter protein
VYLCLRILHSIPRHPLLALGLSVGVVMTVQAEGRAQPEGSAPAVVPPVVVKKVEPVYPPDAASAGRQGEVVLTVVVDASGAVGEIGMVTSGGDDLDQAAIAAVRQWLFQPARQAGQPVPTRIRVPIAFLAPAPAAAPADAPAETSPGLSAAPQPAQPAPPSTPPAPGDHAVLPAPATEILEATVAGKQRPRSRGTADFEIEIGALSLVPRASAADMLKLAPGILLTNEGGEAHAEQIFLRGFDAREGQDIEIAVGGVPVNESGNLHGNGYADLHFVIPEVVEALRVIEGPFSPSQGNYAVAGSVDYDLGLAERGLGVKVGRGSYDTQRLLLTYGAPRKSSANFTAAELFQTKGYGKNRDASRGAAINQIDGRLSDWHYRLLMQGYAARYHSAGVVREDDYASGRVGFFDTYDFNQGGNASRFSLGLELASSEGATSQKHVAFLVSRSMGLRENFTGFLEDPQEPLQNPHGQRGDLLDISARALTFGAHGQGRIKGSLLGEVQEIAMGYFARGDVTSGTQQRIEAATLVPYRTDLDISATLADLGLYVDTSLKPLRWLTARGGLRGDLFTYDVTDNCAAKSVAHPSKTDPPGDQSCLDQQDYGRHRERNQRVQTSAIAWMPRAALLLGPWRNVTLSASWGKGMRSIDPQFVSNDIETPFATAESWEAGVAWGARLRSLGLSARTAAFRTHVDRDLIFSETTGRNMLGGGTTRLGWLLSARASGRTVDSSLNVTLVRSSFDDTGLLIPYVPDLVVRSDNAVFGTVWSPHGQPITARAGLGVTYVGRRALPLGQRSDAVFTVDASGSLAYRQVFVELRAMNLLDRRYRLGEYNYASDFHSSAWPTLVPARHFTAGAPRTLMLSLGITLGGSS